MSAGQPSVIAGLRRRLGITYPDCSPEEWETYLAVELAAIGTPPLPGDTVFD